MVEGHVPADLLMRFLEEHSSMAGITVPGMIMGPPGMEGSVSVPYDVLTVPGMIMGPPGMEGSVSVPYDVLTFDREGKSTIYESRRSEVRVGR